MSMRDSELFHQAVAWYFEPIASRLGLLVIKINEGVYDFSSPHFIMRIRLDTGHARALNVLLRPADQRDFDENEPFIEYGIGCFMEFYGEKLESTFFDVVTDEDFLKQAQLLALVADRLCVPYLLGQRKDFDRIAESVRKRSEISVEKIKKYKFPTFAQKRWHLPKD